ncbi:Mitochondrial glycoprotein family protein [Corchorus capsularis]|uniref:Mitochondrial glycoprotein family protein n=1 Tax=Corchorus capsularis TaxID=210143 RepID=A0A1R3H7S0_COCAP|nr:Mitochondrial glycoprotein family protein [Corchorus capsularis]
MASYVMLRRVPATAMAVANRAMAVANRTTVSLKAAAHGHGQELYGTQRPLISSMFFSSKSKKQKEKVVVSSSSSDSSSSDSDEDGSDVWSSESDLSDHDSDHGDNSVAENPVDNQNQAPESEPTMAILDIIGSKLQSKSKTSTVKPDAEKYSKIPFGIEFFERSPTLTLKRNYGNEEITVGVSKDALDAGKDLVPLNVSVTKNGGVSLHFGVNAFPEKLEITSYLTSTTDAGGVRSYQEPPFSEIVGSNLFMNFMAYLDVRGINASTINALRVEKKPEPEPEKDSLEWMKNLKKFMEM